MENTKYFMVERRFWLAQPSIGPNPLRNLPTNSVLILPSNTDHCEIKVCSAFSIEIEAMSSPFPFHPCSDLLKAHCIRIVRYIQMQHIERMSENDIMYNFLIGEDNNIYEGRGWKYRSAARLQTEFGYDTDGPDGSLSIAWIATFHSDGQTPSHHHVDKTRFLLEQGVLGGKLWANYTIILERNLYCFLRNDTLFAAAKVVQAETASKLVLKPIQDQIC